jgi:hypothetical protein
MRQFISRLFARKAAAPARRTPAKFRPRVDALEARDVPAIVDWTGIVSDDMTVADNWVVPGEGGAHRLPTSADDVFFAGHYSSSRDCGNFAGDYNSVHLGLGYMGTVTLAGALNAGALELLSGTIDQPIDGTDITVTGGSVLDDGKSFLWTGGILNSTTHLATVHITGATGQVLPPDVDALDLGSTLSLEDEAVVEFDPGEIDAHNDPEINLCGNCEADATLNITLTPKTLRIFGVTQINLTTGDKLDVAGGTMYANCPIYNNNGALVIHGSGEVNLTGTVTYGLTTVTNSYYQQGSSPLLSIESGSALTVENPARMDSGVLQTLYNENLADTVAAQKATINGDLQVRGGTVQICFGGGAPGHYGTLYVSGSVVMSGGTYHPYVKGAQAGTCDLWKSGGDFSVNPAGVGTASLNVTDPDGPATVANSTWTIIESGGTYSGTWASMSLQYDAGPPAKSFTYGTSGTPVNKVILTT